MFAVFQVHLIQGVMLGFEWIYDEGFLVFDLFIIRLIIDYKGIQEE